MTTEINTREIVIACLGGNCPVQAEGTIDGKPFYFRSRGEHWSMSIGGEDVVSNPEWRHEEEYGDGPFEAGWITEDEAREFMEKSAGRFHMSSRFRGALTTLGRSAASLAPLLSCHPRTCQGWLQAGPPPEVLAWVEAMADAVSSIPVPGVKIVAGRKPGARQNASSAASGVERG